LNFGLHFKSAAWYDNLQQNGPSVADYGLNERKIMLDDALHKANNL